MQGEDKKEEEVKTEHLNVEDQKNENKKIDKKQENQKAEIKKTEKAKTEIKKTEDNKLEKKKTENKKIQNTEKVKIKGRSPIWYWAFLIVGNAIFIHQLIFNRNNTQSLVFGLIAVNLVFLPIVIKNVVEIDDQLVCLKMGFFKEKINISSVKEIRRKPSKIFKNSPSHEKLIIKGKDSYVMVAVKEKERLISELQKRKKNIKVYD